MDFWKCSLFFIFLGIFLSLAQAQQQKAILSNVEDLCFDLTASFKTVWEIDGVPKEVITLNDQFPGPTIRARKNDLVTFRIHNNLTDHRGKPHSTTVHFHGLEQKKTPWYDGPDLVTQCPIPFGEYMEYTFQLHQEGTYWYHSHTEWQYIDGFWGFFIVESDEPFKEVHRYHDELMISLMDWHWHAGSYLTDIFHLPTDSCVPINPNPSDPPNSCGPTTSCVGIEPLLCPGKTPNPDSILINSKGNANCARALEKGFSCSESGNFTEFTVQPGQTYRIRVLNPSARASFLFSIDGHRLRVIEVDGVDTVETDPVDVVEIWPAQRYSFLVTMNATQPFQHFRIRADMVIGGNVVTGLGEALAALRYSSFIPDPSCSNPDFTVVSAPTHPSFGEGVQGRPDCGYVPSQDPNIQRAEFLYTSRFANQQAVPCTKPTLNMEPSSRILSSSCLVDLSTGGRSPNPVLLNQMACRPFPSAQCLPEEDGYPKTVDHTVILTAELDTHPNQTNRWYFSDISYNLEDHKYPALFHSLNPRKVPKEFSPQEIPLGKNIEVIINNLNGGHHPYHLHGHTFWVMGTGEANEGRYNPDRDAWKIENTTPIKRDTTHTLPFSWTVVRFRSNNPGTWLLHCHIHWHFDIGLGAVLVEGGDKLPCIYAGRLPLEARRVCCLNGVDVHHKTGHCGPSGPHQQPKCRPTTTGLLYKHEGSPTIQVAQDGVFSNSVDRGTLPHGQFHIPNVYSPWGFYRK